MKTWQIYFLLCMSAVCAALMSGCEQRSNGEVASYFSHRGQAFMDQAGEVCKNGVVYYFSAYDRSAIVVPAYNPDSTVKTCK